MFKFLLLLGLWTLTATAQFGFFDQMFGQGGQQQQQQANVRSDSSWYQAQYENGRSNLSSHVIFQTLPSITVLIHSPAQCSHYLCPGTLSCVHFPHHCPCAWEAAEDKVELGEGISICGSKGGWKEGEFAKKVELARKGLL